MSRNFRDSAITLLAITTAYGLGILTAVACEVKMAVEVYKAAKTQKEKQSKDD